MAEEERAGGQNVWLLVVALALAAVVVVIYNVHIYNVRRAARGEKVYLLRVIRDVEAGETLRDDDVEVAAIEKQHASMLGSVVGEENMQFAVGSRVNRAIPRNHWLLWDYITDLDTAKPANAITPGNVAVTVSVDPRLSLGDILRQNDRVNILGQIPQGQSLRTYRLIEGVRVLAIGGQGLKVSAGLDATPRSRRGMRTYRNITIEVTPETSIELSNLLTYVSGDCWVELISSKADKKKSYGRVNPELANLAAAPSKTGGGGRVPGGGGAMPPGQFNDFE